MSKKRKSIFSIFDELSANFVDGIREGLENFNNLIGSVVEFMELAGDIDTIDMMEKKLKKVEIEGEDSEEDEEENIITPKV
ncbi:MAG: hypothetical protein ACFFDN_04705 [Candidatus Hodarchaeota archaeon]